MREKRTARVEGSGLTVGLVHWALPPIIGGVESHLADYIRLLAERGVRVIVFTGESEVAEELRKLAEIEYHPILHLAGGGVVPDEGDECVADLKAWLAPLLEFHQVDVIHGHNLHYFSSVPATALNAVCTELGIERHHTYHNYWGDNTHFANLIAAWEGHWANSDFVAKLCADGYPGKAPITRYIGIDPDRFLSARQPFEGRDPEASDPRDAPVILQPARLLRWKRPIDSVNMLRRLHETRYRARLVLTDTPTLIDWDDERKKLRAELTDLIDDYGLTQWVTFEDKALYSDMPRLYADADIVINPSRGEPLGLVALEAMAASRPIVVTNSGGMRETTARGTGAIVSDNRDRDLDLSLLKAVRGFLRHPERAVKAGQRGRRRVVDNFHMNKYVDYMITEYRASQVRSYTSKRGASPDVAELPEPTGAAPGQRLRAFALRR